MKLHMRAWLLLGHIKPGQWFLDKALAASYAQIK